MILIILLTITALELATVCAIGEPCTANSICTDPKSYCKIGSPTCGSGICECQPGYAFNTNENVCRKASSLGQFCREGDICLGLNMACLSGICQCDRGFKTGPRGNDCVSAAALGNYGDKCFDSVQCYYNLKCIGNRCDCFTGWINSQNGFECRPRTLDDGCAQSSDCSRTPNTVCSSGRCSCAFGYKETTFMTSATTTEKACIAETASLALEGNACNTTLDSNGEGWLCKQPFVCSACQLGQLTCNRIVPPLYSKAQLLTLSCYIYIIIVGCVIFSYFM